MHKKKRRKNLVLLALIFLWCLLIWAITMVKLAHAQDITKSYIDGRTKHQEETIATEKKWLGPDGQKILQDRDQAEKTYFEGAIKHRQEADAALQKWNSDWTNIMAPEREAAYKKWSEEAIAHRDYMNAQPEKWWAGWEERLDPEKSKDKKSDAQ